MNDIEMRKSILQFAYDHKYDHHLRFVYAQDMPFLKEVDALRRVQILQILRDNGLIKNENSTWTAISITTRGIFLVEHPRELDAMFPVHYELPQRTKKLVDTVEELLAKDCPDVWNQFRKAESFLFDARPPDYLNSVKDAVGAVEGLSKVLFRANKGTLSNLIPEIKQKYLGHPAMAKILEAIYAVRSDEPGIGHGAYEPSSFGYEDAEFVLGISACVIIYLMRKEGN